MNGAIAESRPTMFAVYDRAKAALTAALNSTRFDIVLANRDDLGLIKVHARQIRDRTLLADATEFQMRVERHLGRLLIAAREAGYVGNRDGGRPRNGQATLPEIGITRKLSMRAHRAAAIKDDAFEKMISDMRDGLSARGAKVVDIVPHTRTKPDGDNTGAKFRLMDGTRLGQLRIGRLRSRIIALRAEAGMLEAIERYVGDADNMASVAETINDLRLERIISAYNG